MKDEIQVIMPQRLYDKNLQDTEKRADLKGYTKAWNDLANILKSEINGYPIFEQYLIPDTLDRKSIEEVIQFIRLRRGLIFNEISPSNS